jgi:hypothetical protein
MDVANPGSPGIALGKRIVAPPRKVIAAQALPQTAAASKLHPWVLGKQIGEVAALSDPEMRPTLQAEWSVRHTCATHGRLNCI